MERMGGAIRQLPDCEGVAVTAVRATTEFQGRKEFRLAPGFIRGFPKSLSATLAAVPCISSFPFPRFLISLASGIKNLRDFLDRVPIARGDRHTQALLDLAEVADRLHLPTIQTQDESVLDGNDLQQPVIVRG